MYDISALIKAHYLDAIVVSVTKAKRIVVESNEYLLSNGQYLYETPVGVIRKKDGGAYEPASENKEP